MGAGYKIKPGLPVVRARVRAFTRFGFPCSNPDQAVELLSGVRSTPARCAVQETEGEAPAVAFVQAVFLGVRLKGRSKTEGGHERSGKC